MILKKKTKIVATIGPATESEEMLTKLLKSGLNVIRMNFSHGDFAEHQKKVNNGRAASKKTGIPVAFLQDLGGPKIRLGEFNTESGRINIKKGQIFVLTTRKLKGDETISHVNYEKLPKEAKVGERIMLDDGKKRLEILEIKGTEIICKVIVGGELKGRRGVNLPDTDISISSLTQKDKDDLKFGIKNKVDFFALSFVRRPSDITELRNILKKAKCSAGIIAKIETPQAVKNIDEIISLSDGIMVARGDLAIEVPAEEVPLIQKNVINKCNLVGKPVITATQMLESMIHSPVPTRAEVSDIANAILDGTDAVMLSEETTLGEYPLEAVEIMAKVAKRTESDYLHEQLLSAKDLMHDKSISGAISAYAVKTAHKVDAKFIVSLTNSGSGARAISKHRPSFPILAFTPKDETMRKLVLSFGCWVFKIAKYTDFQHAINDIRKNVLKNKLASKGDKFVVVAARPFGNGAETNMILVETV
ncbi:MAG TPA: pyruvate kinase [Candidatus Paceibacterota bacterium]|nr:pyruvate kinase [Candidatus Paceibacterota bacterium]